MRYILVLLLALQFACKPAIPEKEKASQASSDKLLRVFALEGFRKSGLESTLIPDFEKEFQCRVDLSLFTDPASMIKSVKLNENRADVVFGIPSEFSKADSLDGYFQPYQPKAKDALNRDCLEDEEFRLIPYGFSYLGLIYNSSLLENPPVSFGELQDDRYLSQMALTDPAINGSGRAMLHMCLALFGNEGFEQMLRALRKNVSRSFENHELALASVISGESTMMPGLITLPAWLNEKQSESSTLEFKLFSEGSFLYTECMGIGKNSETPDLAHAFIDFVLRESSQKMVIYKLGLFPANRKTMLPPSFSKVPISPWLLNNRLTARTILEHSGRWLETWSSIFVVY